MYTAQQRHGAWCAASTDSCYHCRSVCRPDHSLGGRCGFCNLQHEQYHGTRVCYQGHLQYLGDRHRGQHTFGSTHSHHNSHRPQQCVQRAGGRGSWPRHEHPPQGKPPQPQQSTCHLFVLPLSLEATFCLFAIWALRRACIPQPATSI